MELARDLTIIVHFIGLALIIGPFVAQMRAKGGYWFPVVLTGASVQLITGLILVTLLELDSDEPVNHAKVGVKLTLALVAFIAALIGYRKQKKLGAGESDRALMPFFHTAGGLAVINIVIAVLW